MVKQVASGGARLNFRGMKIDMNVVAQIALIQNYGSRFDWYQALVCPCSVTSQDEGMKFRKLACTLCNGTGWTYILNKEIRAVPSSARRQEDTLTYRIPAEGQLSNIYVNLTCEPEYKVNIRDRLVFKESVTFRSQGALYSENISSYRFTFPIVELMKVIDRDGKEYNCTDLFEENRDVTVQDGNLVWLSGKSKPAPGTAFSILYNFNPSYIVITAAHEIRGFTAGKPAPEGRQVYEDLPRLFTAKLEIPSKYLFE